MSIYELSKAVFNPTASVSRSTATVRYGTVVTPNDDDNKISVIFDGSAVPITLTCETPVIENQRVAIANDHGVYRIIGMSNMVAQHDTAYSFVNTIVNVNQISANDIVADHASINRLDVDELIAAQAYIDELVAADITADSISADHATIEELDVDNLNAVRAYVNALTAGNVTANKIIAANGYIEDLNAADITAESIIADHAAIEELDVDDLNAAKAYIEELVSENVTADNIIAANAYISDLNAANITAGTITADHATVSSLDTNYLRADTANISKVIANEIIAKSALLDDAVVDNTTITGILDATKIEVANLSVGDLNVNTINGVTVPSSKRPELVQDFIDYFYSYNATTGVLTNNVDESFTSIESQLSTFASTVAGDLTEIQNQIDGSITTWFYEVAPTISNPPANGWTTTDDKNVHLGDLYYDTITGYCYRWQLSNNTYSWQKLSDSDITAAMNAATNAQDTADNKRRVFYAQPTPPYDRGDLWAGGSTGDLKICNTSKASGGLYSASDWVLATKYTDDSTANAAQTAVDNLSTTVSELDEAFESYQEEIDSELENLPTTILSEVSATYETKSDASSGRTALNALISSNASEIASVASRTTTLETNVDGLSDDINDTTNGLKKRMTSAESSITQNANAITLKANSTDVYSKNEVYTKTEADNKYTTLAEVQEEGYLTVDSSAIQGVISRVTTAEGTIESLQTTVEATANGLEVVSNDIANNLISKINLTPGEATIQASKLNLSGYLTISNGDTRYDSAGSANAVKTGLATSNYTTINGGNITTGTIDASQATITNINASNVTTGTLSAERLAAGSISAKFLSIADPTNYCEVFEYDSNSRISGGQITSDGYISNNASGTSSSGTRLTRLNKYDLTSDDEFLLTGTVLLESAGTVSAVLTTNDESSESYYTVGTFSESIPANTPTKIQIIYDLSSVSIDFKSRQAFSVEARNASHVKIPLKIKNVRLEKKSSSKLIVDGAITANKIAASAITANKIAAGTITGDKLNMNEVFTHDITATGNFKVGQLQNGSYALDYNKTAGTLDLNVNGFSAAFHNFVTTDSMSTQLGSVRGDINDLVKTVQENETGTAASLSNMQAQIQNSKSDLATIRSVISFNDESPGIPSMTMATTANGLSLKLTNSELSFNDSGERVAYINNQILNISKAQIINSLQIGNYAFVSGESDHVSLVHIG